MGKGGSITEGSRHQPIRSQLVEKLEEEEGEEVWRSNLFVMIYIKTEWGEGKKERNHKIQWKWSSRLGDRMSRRRRRKSLQQWDRLSATGCSRGREGGWMAGRQSDTYVIVGEYMSPVGAGGRHSFNNSYALHQEIVFIN